MESYVKEQILSLLALLLLFTIGYKVIWRWRVLHGVEAQATVYQRLGRQGSMSAGVYAFLVRYQHPQRGLTTARIETSRSRYEAVSLGSALRVAYRHDAPLDALPADDHSLTWPYAIGMFTCALLVAPLLSRRRQR